MTGITQSRKLRNSMVNLERRISVDPEPLYGEEKEERLPMMSS